MADGWLEAQYSVLGSVLISPEVAPKVMRATSELDFSGGCLTVYRKMRELFLAGVTLDPVVIANALDPSYRAFLLELMEITPTAANVDQYISICRDQSRVTAIQDLAREMETASSPEKLQTMVEQAAKLLASKPTRKIVTMADALRTFMDRQSSVPNYLSWPIKTLDKHIYAEAGDFIVIGGYPSAGKTAWALQCAWHWAKTKKVGFFSLETSSEKLFDRQMASVAQLEMEAVKRHQIDHAGWDRICTMTETITSRKLELVPAAGMSPAEVRSITLMQGYEIIFVDYLQLLKGSGENRTAEVSSISIALHTMAQSLGVTVVALSQLSRQQKGQRRAAPSLSDLRESGQIEQDADLVLLLSLDDPGDPEGLRILSIEKNKEGRLGDIPLNFDGQRQLFSICTDLQRSVEQQAAVKNKIKPKPEPKSKPKETAKEIAGQYSILPNSEPVPFNN